MNNKKTNKHRGGKFDDFLRDEGMLEECTASAVKAVLAMEIADAMKENNITKRALAEKMHSSRSQLDRILDPSETGT
ncbi:XRE family transcriptional regulator, partial [Mariprofundus ferrooxydans]|nr:XRE family transcriptional regulator [Mariprofundus ferrooxydans]